MRRLFGALILTCGIQPALGADLVYTPVNPSFGGSPLNSSHLLSIAGAQKSAPSSSSRSQSTSERFLQILQSRLYSSLASNVSDAIFGEGAQDVGTVKLDGLEVAWNNTGTEIAITVIDENTGQITEIVVPTVIQ